jgi:hypothetical protein
MKSLAIMQPYFFPYIGYWQLIHAVDRFVIYDDVNYIVRGWVNRNRLLINGQPSYITVPLQQASQNMRICDLSLQTSPVWRDKLVKSVEIAYRKAPCFAEVFSVIKSVMGHETNNLSDYLAHQLQTLAAFMGIQTEFVLTSRCYGNNDMSGQERILDICKREGATNYINPQGGQALYDWANFTQNGLDLKFLVPSAIDYKQFGSLHVPWLSIIDVLMFNGIEGTNKLLENYSVQMGDK